MELQCNQRTAIIQTNLNQQIYMYIYIIFFLLRGVESLERKQRNKIKFKARCEKFTQYICNMINKNRQWSKSKFFLIKTENLVSPLLPSYIKLNKNLQTKQRQKVKACTVQIYYNTATKTKKMEEALRPPL